MKSRRTIPGALLIAVLVHSGETPQTIPDPAEDDRQYAWTRLTGSAEFSKTYNYQLFADSHHVLAFHPSGVWLSADGESWRKTELTNIVGNQAFLDYVTFKGFIYALGTFEGNIERFTQSGQIARTADFRTWEILATDSNLPKRFFFHPFVFRDSIWIMGGSDGTRTYSDAWVSTDAVHWEKVADNLPFGRRAGNRFIVFRDSLYMLDNDAWVSSDGIHWTMLTSQIAEGDIFGYSAEVFDGRIWLIGCSRSGRFRSEVLHSRDGIRWTAERAPWSPRGGVATCIFKDQLIMTGGKYGGPGIEGRTEFVYSNDVWALRKGS